MKGSTKMKSGAVAVLLMALSNFVFGAGCLIHSCDPSIQYAMGKERGVLSKRIGNYIGGIKALTRDANDTRRLYKIDAHELSRMLARYKIRAVKISERAFHEKRIQIEYDLAARSKTLIKEKK